MQKWPALSLHCCNNYGLGDGISAVSSFTERSRQERLPGVHCPRMERLEGCWRLSQRVPVSPRYSCQPAHEASSSPFFTVLGKGKESHEPVLLLVWPIMGIFQVATFDGAKNPGLWSIRLGISHAGLLVGDLSPKCGLVTAVTVTSALQETGKW